MAATSHVITHTVPPYRRHPHGRRRCLPLNTAAWRSHWSPPTSSRCHTPIAISHGCHLQATCLLSTAVVRHLHPSPLDAIARRSQCPPTTLRHSPITLRHSPPSSSPPLHHEPPLGPMPTASSLDTTRAPLHHLLPAALHQPWPPPQSSLPVATLPSHLPRPPTAVLHDCRPIYPAPSSLPSPPLVPFSSSLIFHPSHILPQLSQALRWPSSFFKSPWPPLPSFLFTSPSPDLPIRRRHTRSTIFHRISPLSILRPHCLPPPCHHLSIVDHAAPSSIHSSHLPVTILKHDPWPTK